MRSAKEMRPFNFSQVPRNVLEQLFEIIFRMSRQRRLFDGVAHMKVVRIILEIGIMRLIVPSYHCRLSIKLIRIQKLLLRLDKFDVQFEL